MDPCTIRFQDRVLQWLDEAPDLSYRDHYEGSDADTDVGESEPELRNCESNSDIHVSDLENYDDEMELSASNNSVSPNTRSQERSSNDLSDEYSERSCIETRIERAPRNTMFTRCFVTVGTTQFDLLCQRLQSESVRAALARLGVSRVTVQAGRGDAGRGECDLDGIRFTLYAFKDSIESDIRQADLVISHAGAGSCLEVLEQNKPLLVVVNEQLMHNHQVELAEQLQVGRHLYYCTCDTLEETLLQVDFKALLPFPKPDSNAFVKYINSIFKTKPCDSTRR